MKLLLKYRQRLAIGVLALWALTGILPASYALAGDHDLPVQQVSCPSTSSNNYSSGAVYQYDLDNPVRPASNHADKNLALRSYAAVSEAAVLVSYGKGDSKQPPQFATLFNPDRMPTLSGTYRANHWNWASPPNPGSRSNPITSPPVTVLGLETTPGEVLEAPTHGRDLGSPWGKGGSVVIFADEDSITLKFTREDSAAVGYTVHIDNICVDPNLLALYNSLDNADRNSTGTGSGNKPRDSSTDYSLPGLRPGQPFGTARDSEIRVAIVDTGAFQDPRSRDDWWQIRPAPPPLGVPSPASPANGATSVENPITLAWNPVNGATSYRVRLDDSSSFGSPTLDTTVSGTSTVAPNLTAGKKYYWQVYAIDGSGNKSAWSAKWSLTVAVPPPPPGPTLFSPDDGADTPQRPLFEWEAIAGATRYQLQVAAKATFSGVVINKNKLTTTTFEATKDLSRGKTYYWRVRARDASGKWGSWSETRTFFVP